MKRKLNDFKGYLFDADGTLFNTTELIFKCFENTARVMRKPPLDRTTVFSHIGLTLRDQMNVYFGPLTTGQFEQFKSVHMGHQMMIYQDHLRLFDGIEKALEKLKAKKKRCAVVTSRMKNTLELFLRETGILQYFDILVTPESTAKHKPDPEPALRAAELLGCACADSVFVGDALFDMECGQKAGMATAFVSWSAVAMSSLTTVPTYIVKHPKELYL
jgi:pyrophosphatase PpaX